MATRKRSYDDGCATAHALDLIGERWALLVARELLLGPRRFTDLRAGLPGVSPNVLAQRLGELEEAYVVRRRRLPPPAAAWVYELTGWGLELEPVIRAVGRWAARSPAMPQGSPMSVSSVVMSFRTMFDPARAAGFEASVGLRLGGEEFRAEFADGQMELARGEAERPDAIIDADDPNALAAVAYAGRDLEEAVRAGEVRIGGDRAVVERFLTLFPLPARAPASAPTNR
jgi:DNA-binding HxlR family transcriptional regulator